MDKRGIATALIIAVIFGLTTMGLGTYIVYDNVKVNSGNSVQSQTESVTSSGNTNTEQSTSVEGTTQNNDSQIIYNTSDLKIFWTNFRKVVISGDYNNIKKFVNFPLLTKGPLDSSKTIEVSEAEFENVFKTFLQKDTGLGDNENILSWIKRNEMPEMKSGLDYENANSYKDLVRLEDSWARFSDMIMVKDDDGNWKLKQIFVES